MRSSTMNASGGFSPCQPVQAPRLCTGLSSTIPMTEALGLESETRSPVLALIFNRPDYCQGLLDVLRKARPPRLYVAADGPRENIPADKEYCEASRAVFDEVDWPCEVHRLFRKRNLGCGRAVYTGITWFFQHEAEGIILEDDVRPSPQFFRFCDAMLARYRHDERIMHITGNNFQFGRRHGKEAWYFSHYNHIWGWASWARAWKYYNFSIPHVSSFIHKQLPALVSDPVARTNWTNIFRTMASGKIDTWDYQWTYICLREGGLTVTPNANLVVNIGFDERSTHTSGDNLYSYLKTEVLEENWEADVPVEVCSEADTFIEKTVFTTGQAQWLNALAEASTRLQLGQYEGALELLNALHSHFGSHEILLQLLCLTYKAIGDRKSALLFMEELLIINPNNPQTLTILHSLK